MALKPPSCDRQHTRARKKTAAWWLQAGRQAGRQASRQASMQTGKWPHQLGRRRLCDGAWATAGPAWATALGRRRVQALRATALERALVDHAWATALGRRRLGDGGSSSRARTSALSSIIASIARLGERA